MTDAEVVTLCVAQAVMDLSSDREFLAIARRRLSHLFPQLPKQPGYLKRRRRLADTIDWLTAVFAADSPGGRDAIVLLDSTPVECGRSVETARRSELADACGSATAVPIRAGFGACACIWPAHPMARRGRRSSPRPTRRSARWRCGCCRSRSMAARRSSATRATRAVIFEQLVAERFDAKVLRPSRADEPHTGLHLSSIRQLVESVFWTLKDRLGLERHRARTLAGIRARVASKLLALAAGVWLNHLLGRPTRAFADLAV